MTNPVRTKVFGVLLAAGLGLASSGCAQAAPPEARAADGGQVPGDPDEVVATVGDRAITLRELDGAWQDLDAASHRRLQQQIYDARRQALEQLIGDLLIAGEARARGMTAGELVAAEQQRRLRPVTDEEIAATFQSIRSRMPPEMTLDEARRPIREALEAQREQEVREALLDELRGGASVAIRLDPPRLAIHTRAGEPAMGPPGAPVEIVEYTDYQ